MNDLDEMLGRARRVVASPEAKARLRGPVLGAAAVAAGVISPAAASAAAKLALGAGKVSMPGFLLYVAGGVALSALALGPLALLGYDSRATKTTVAPVQSSNIVRQALSAASAPTSAPAGELAGQPPVAPTLPLASAKSSKSATPPPSIDREMLLLGEAQRELRRGAPEAALQWLARYEAEFPRGVLAEEAAAARAISACSRSATQRSAELERFRARFPTSALAPRVGRACSISHDDFELGLPSRATQFDEARPVGSGAEGELR